MGCTVVAKSLDCSKQFELDQDGGFIFHLVRCDLCGRTKSIGFDELGDLRLRYMKELSDPDYGPDSKSDNYSQKHAPLEPISEDEYYAGVEAFAGKCKCGEK